MLLSVAKDSVRGSRLDDERLLDSLPLDDHYSMGVLGPILSGLRDLERGKRWSHLLQEAFERLILANQTVRIVPLSFLTELIKLLLPFIHASS